MQKFFRIILILISFSFLFQNCQSPDKEEKIKYYFLFIGDGMGVAQVNLTEAYLAAMNDEIGFQQLSFTQFPHAGLVSTHANNRLITCSAAAGTAFATGYKTNINHISTDTSGRIPYKSIATICKEIDMKVGIISSVSIDHATPAVFYANQPTRNNYFEIGVELANSNFDFFGGGGFKSPKGLINGDSVDVYDLVSEKGFKVVNSYNGLINLDPGSKKVFAYHPDLLESGAMPYAIDMPDVPTLADFTTKAIELLDNENGFFIMVEGGKIDWACHKNDAATSIAETLAFDDAVQAAIEFYNKHPGQTLILVTADHETGGLALGADKTGYNINYKWLRHQKISFDRFNEELFNFRNSLSGNYNKDLDNLLALVDRNFGLGSSIPLTGEEKSKIWFAFEKSTQETGQANKLYGDFPPVTETLIKLISEKAGVGWTTYKHTGINIPIYAIGPGSELYSGVIDNTDIQGIMMKQLGVEE
jgi:alkaline phosphatase